MASFCTHCGSQQQLKYSLFVAPHFEIGFEFQRNGEKGYKLLISNANHSSMSGRRNNDLYPWKTMEIPADAMTFQIVNVGKMCVDVYDKNKKAIACRGCLSSFHSRYAKKADNSAAILTASNWLTQTYLRLRATS